MKAFASSDSFLGLPERGKFATEPVIRIFLTIRVTLARLALKPSFLKDLNIAIGVRPCLSLSARIRLVSKQKITEMPEKEKLDVEV